MANAILHLYKDTSSEGCSNIAFENVPNAQGSASSVRTYVNKGSSISFTIRSDKNTPDAKYGFYTWRATLTGLDINPLDFEDNVTVRFASATSEQTTVTISYDPPTMADCNGNITFKAIYNTYQQYLVNCTPVKSEASSYGGYATPSTSDTLSTTYRYQNQKVEVKSHPNGGYKTSSWTVTDYNTGQVLFSKTSGVTTDYSFTMPAKKVNVIATFAATTKYEVKTSASPTGSGTFSGAGNYSEGSSVTITANAASGYVFSSFLVSPNSSGMNVQVDGNKCTFTMPAMTVNVTGTFVKLYTISANTEPDGVGTTVISGSYTHSSSGSHATGTAYQGQSISITTSVTDTNYVFDRWELTGATNTSASTKRCQFTMPANAVTARAIYTSSGGGGGGTTTQYTLSLSSAGNGSVSGGGTYNEGTSVSAQATPSNNYHFVSWTEGGSVASSANPYTFTLNSDRSLVANFAQNAAGTSTITVSSGNTSQGTVTGGGTYQQGQSVTITANPKPGYKFVNWTSGGSVISTSNPYSFTVGTSNQTIVANFAPIVYNIIWDYDGGTADFSDPDFVYDPLSGGYTSTVNNSDAPSGKYTYLYNPLTLAYDFSNYGLNGGSKREFFRCKRPSKLGYTFIGWQITGITDDATIKKAHYTAEGEERASWHEISGTSFNTSTLPSSQISNPFRYLRTTEGTVVFKALYEYAQGWIPVQVKIRKNGDWEDVPVRMRQT